MMVFHYSLTHIPWFLPTEFTEMFNHHLKKLIEQGVIKKVIHKWLPPPTRDFEKKASVLGYENLTFPFMLLAVGVAIASMMLLAETSVLKKTRRREQGRITRVSAQDLIEQEQIEGGGGNCQLGH